MFKCSECGTEYDVKPDYCDCGNDTFEEIAEKKESLPPKEEKKETPKLNIPKIEPVKTQPVSQAESKTQSYDYSRLRAFFDPISTIIFLSCLILAVVILFWRTEDSNNVVNKPAKVNIQDEIIISDIPSIDKFWDSTPVSYNIQPEPKIVEQVKEDPKIVKMVEQVFKPQKSEVKPKAPVQVKSSQKTSTPVKAVAQKPIQTASKPKTTVQPVQSTAKITSPSQSVTDLTNRVKNNIQYTSTASSIASNTVPKNASAPKVTSTPSTSGVTKSTQTVSQSSQSSQTSSQNQKVPAIRTNAATTSKPVVATQDSAAAKRELANYKSSLRNYIGRKIDFTRVVGDGDCALSFKINSAGRLTNRAFTKQSSNVTLNDAVYVAMNSAVNYNPPPSAYKNETINLKVRFYNGNFEISLY